MRIVLSAIIFVILVVVGSAIHDEIYKKKISSVRIPCHKDTTVFEKIIENRYLNFIKQDIFDKNISIIIAKKESVYTKTTLFEYISLEKIKSILKELLHVNSVDNYDKSTILNIYVYENDPKDPNKKSDSCKFFRGYLVMTFAYKQNPVYKIQIDFYDKKGQDIKNVLECALKSLDTIE